MDPLLGFQFEKIIDINTHTKTLNILGNYGTEEKCILIIEKLSFNESDLITSFRDLSLIGHNDIYSWISCRSEIADKLKVMKIYPVTQKHIDKYSRKSMIIFVETPQTYNTLIFPKINLIPKDHTKWISNALVGKSDEIPLFADKNPKVGFMVLPDSKWDQKNLNTMYYLVIPQLKLKCLRDLTVEHLDLLINIKDTIPKIIKEKHGVDYNRIVMYIHYPPTYYHLHIHITNIDNTTDGLINRNHGLHTIINNLEIDGNYYRKCHLQYAINEKDEFYKDLIK